jgi:succinyl-CoA synthetase beta subunit
MDASLLEINPFLLTKDNRLIALDAKVNFDDNALYRHKNYSELRDLGEKTARNRSLEIRFELHQLDGNIGCMVNGAGLAMATMDIINSRAANRRIFWMSAAARRRSGSNRRSKSARDENVKAVLINIFGGIVRCDMVANGVVAAAKNLGVSIPIVARLEGTNVEEGRRVLLESDIGIISADGMNDAAEKVVAAAARTTKNFQLRKRQRNDTKTFRDFSCCFVSRINSLSMNLSKLQENLREAVVATAEK